MKETFDSAYKKNRNYDKDSNYNKVTESWRLRFLEMDHDAIIKKFHLESDEEALYITYFSHRMRIDRGNGVISFFEEPERRVCFDTAMDIYNLFHYSIETPAASGKLVPFREVKRVYPFEAAYKRTVLKTFQDVFEGHVEELKSACEKLGGTELPQGDAGYRIPVFPFFDIAVFFWDGDEEFSAQGNMLFDSNITDFLHEENVVCVAADAVYYLAQAAGLDVNEIYAGNR